MELHLAYQSYCRQQIKKTSKILGGFQKHFMEDLQLLSPISQNNNKWSDFYWDAIYFKVILQPRHMLTPFPTDPDKFGPVLLTEEEFQIFNIWPVVP